MENNQRAGLIQAFSAYIIWGLFPLYWILLAHLPATEIMANRIIWSFILLAIWIAIKGRWKEVWAGVCNPKTLGILFATSLLIGSNWIIYIWSVNNGYVVEASMGYYINPLFNVLLGAIFLSERLRKYQYVAIAFAVAGVLFMTLTYGRLPWIALTLAITFGIFALLRKIVNIGSQPALMIETSVILLPAMTYLLLMPNENAIIAGNWSEKCLLIGGGLVTILPLIFLANALKKLTLSTVGLIQYISPTLQFLCGVAILHEPFSWQQAISFVLIWIGLIIYTTEAVITHRKRRQLS